MKTNLIVSIALAGLASSVVAQVGPPRSGSAPSSQSQGGSGSASKSGPQSNSDAELPDSIRLLGLSSVQTDLSLTSAQFASIVKVANSLKGSAPTEDEGLAAVSNVLSEGQLTRLKELLVQDLGYGSLAVSDIRAQLSLTTDQTTQVTDLISTFQTVKKALASSNSDPSTAQKALSQLQSTTNASLAKVLTPDQDKKLRSLAGKALSTQSS